MKKILSLSFIIENIDENEITDQAIEKAAKKMNDTLFVQKKNSYLTKEVQIKLIEAHAETV